MKKITVSILTTLLMLSMVFSSSVFAANEEVSAWDSFLGLFSAKTAATTDVGVEYRGHVQNKGDFPLDGSWIQGPDQLGTVGESLRLEAFWIKLKNEVPAGLHIQYRVHVQNKGWMAPVEDGALAGTQGESLQIESVEIKLVDDAGNPAVGYSVEYRGHIQNKGDMPADGSWYKDGQQLGTVGEFLRLEALEVKIVQTKADMTAYNAAVAAAGALTEADYTAASWTALETALTDNVVTDANTQAEVDAATAAINAAIDGLVKVTRIESVTATGVKALEVKFNQAVDTTKAVITVKKGTTTVGVAESVWSDDKTLVGLALNSKLTEGTYTVTVTGLESTLTGTVTVENEKITQIKFLSDKLLTTTAATSLATGEGTVGYQVLNQYDEDITTSALASGLSYSTSATSADDDNKGLITVVTKAGTASGDKVVVTIIDPTTAVTANATLTVVDEAAVSTVTFGDIYNADEEVLSEDTLADDFYLIIAPVDQYGTAVTDPALANGGIMLLSSNTSVIGDPDNTIETLTIDDVDYLAVPLNTIAKGTSNITAVVKANGTTATKAVTIAVGTKVDTAVIGTPDGTITGAATINIPVELTNNKGEAVTELSDITSGTTPTVTQNNLTRTSAFVKIDGKLYIQFTSATVPASTTQNLLVTVSTSTGNLASKIFTVKPDAVPTTLVALSSSVSKSILQGQSLVIKDSDFTVEDQYGNTITDVTKYAISGATVAGGKGITVDNSVANQVTIAAASNATADTVTFTLATTTSTIDAKFTAVAASQFASYKVDNFGTLYAPNGANPLYDGQLKVYGVTSAGKEVLLPSDTGLYTVATNTGYLTAVGTTGTTVLTGVRTNLDPDSTTIPASKDVTATVTINATGEELNATGTVTVVAPAIQSIQAVEFESASTISPAALQTASLTPVTSVTFAGNAVFDLTELTGLVDYVAVDQYGVKVALIAGEFAIDDIAAIAPTLTFTPVSGTVTFSANGTNGAQVVTNTANAVFNTRLNAGSVNTTVQVTATAATV